MDALDNIGELEGEPWIAKRDTALLTLLYGCGLRLGEALSLTRADVKAARAGRLTVTGKGRKQRVVPVLAIVAAALDDYLAACPFKHEPLFLGARGGPLHPRIVQDRLQRLRLLAGAAGDGHAPCAAPQLRHPSPGRRRRSARDPGAAGPCLALDDPALYRCGCRRIAGRL